MPALMSKLLDAIAQNRKIRFLNIAWNEIRSENSEEGAITPDAAKLGRFINKNLNL